MELNEFKLLDSSGMKTSREDLGEWGDTVRLADAVNRTLLNRMAMSLARTDLETSLQWGQMAAGFNVFSGTFQQLACLELERTSVAIAKMLPSYEGKERTKGNRQRILHVLTEAYELFGHTKLCRKWIELDPSQAQHDVMLLAQRADLPENLCRTVRARGGKLMKLDSGQTMLERARQLRQFAFANADVVVLHVHPFDLLPNVAFGIPGGPPVIYVNHADHQFWVGGAVADLVLDIRESGQDWTRLHRDIPRTRILPVPLDEDPRLSANSEKRAALRWQTRKSLGIGEDEQIFLTIGAARKYEPIPGISFLETAEAILMRCPRARILAVGPAAKGEWQAVSQRTGGRLMPLGNQSDLGKFHAAADVYLEGMPAGSLTALLEAGLAGLPCVRSPAPVRPPHASDGIALACARQPADIQAYIDEAVSLAESQAKRQTLSQDLQKRIRDTHCDVGWQQQLAQVIPSLPQSHSLYPQQNPRPIDREDRKFKLDYAYHDAAQALVGIMATLVSSAMLDGCKEARHMVEAALPDALADCSSPPAIEQKLFEAILPELPHHPTDRREAGRQPVLDPAVLAKELMVLAAEEGRRHTAWRLAGQLLKRSPAILRHPDFQKGLAKTLPGSRFGVWLFKTTRKSIQSHRK